MKITHFIGHEIYDSRGYPTLSCDLILNDEMKVTATVPSGMSKGQYEAKEIRDEGRLMSMGVQTAIHILEDVLAPELIGKEPSLIEMDALMTEIDDTEDKSSVGANTMLAASMAICRAQAFLEELELYEFIAYLCEQEEVTLPTPMFNVINGGMHAHNSLQIQEFMLMPTGNSTFSESMEIGATMAYALKDLLKKRNLSFAVGDEGGFAADFKDEHEALDLLMQVIELTEQTFDTNILIALDIAASQFFNPKTKKYIFHSNQWQAEDMISWYTELLNEYPIYSIEDGLSDDDWSGWELLFKTFNNKYQIVGDDLFATNPERIWEGINKKVANAVIIKPNQIGTITETLQAVKLAQEHNLKVIVSHRSGETNDSFIADLAVGVSAQQIKAGGFCRGERMAKYNRLLMIEQELMSEYEF